MPLSHLLLALAVVAVWGTNFVVIKGALADLPPLLLATLRFSFSALPWLLWVRRPAVAWRYLVAYGTLMGGQFGLLFFSMRHDITPGLASLVIQSQVFITLVLVALWQHEKLLRLQLAGLTLATLGMVTISWQSIVHGDASVTPWGLALVLVAALCWALANLVSRAIGRIDMLGFIVWSSMFAVPPVLALSLLVEGPQAILQALPRAGWATWSAVAWQVAGNTLFGFGAWGWLMARHPAATVTPMALLVPVFGMGASALLLAEPLPLWKLAAASMVMGGLGLSVFSARQVRSLAFMTSKSYPAIWRP